ncbi:MAG: SURF1 family protein [Pontixanthobacter sp.]
MMRSLPIIPTAFVAIAALIMVALGFWQLGRKDEKAAMLDRYKSVSADASSIAYPQTDEAIEQMLYRRVSANCDAVRSMRGTAGTNTVGAKGWSHIARCELANGQVAEIALGWSRSTRPPDWQGGNVIGTLAPGGKIVADPPLADLGPLAKPDPADLPNNHLAYAVQWFLFALTALVIYTIALRIRGPK